LKAQHQLYQIALTYLKGIGPRKATHLFSRLPEIELIFLASINELQKLTGISKSILVNMEREKAIELANVQVDFVEKYNLTTHFLLDSNYPRRLKQCADAPLLLYSKGDFDPNPPKVLSIVGTRTASDYGKEITEQLIQELKPYNVQIISGLAYGTDYNAHRSALDSGLSTVGVLGHGLDRMYPFSHQAIAKEMCTSGGGLVTEFPSKTLPDRVNFPRRNRIVAGMVDGLVIIESKAKGGSMITSELAFDYNRDVFAFPGSVNQENSKGCNVLIQKNMAHLVTHASDILKLMNWCKSTIPDNLNSINQQSVHLSLIDPKEIRIVDLLRQKGKTHVDQMLVDLNSSVSELNSLLFSMEMEGIVKSYPGKQYSL
jgi:DNA processing protein